MRQRSFGIVMLFLGLLATIPVGSTVPGLMLAAMTVQLIAGRGEPVFPHFSLADEASPAAWRARGLGHHSISLQLTC